MTAIYEFKYISTDRQAFVCLHLFHDFADESMMGSVFLHTDDAVTPTLNQLYTDTACTGKQIERNNAHFKIYVIG